MKKGGLLIAAVIMVVGGIFVVYQDMDSPAGYATGSASAKADVLLRDLRSRNRKVRRAAATALGRAGDLSSLKALTLALEDEDMAFVQQVKRSIDRIVKRFPKNLPRFEKNRYQLQMTAIINETGEGGDKLAASVKDGLLAEFLEYENIQVGTSHQFDDGPASAGGGPAPIALDFSGKITQIEDGECTLELDMALTEVGVVVKRWKAIRAEGETPESSAEACGAEAARQVVKLLGGR